MCNFALNAALNFTLPGTQQAINTAICQRINPTQGRNYAFASVERLGRDIGRSPATIRRHLRAMEEQGIIYTQYVKGRASRIYPVYTLAKLGKPLYLPCRRTQAPYRMGFDAPQVKQTPLKMSAPPLKTIAHPAQNERLTIREPSNNHNSNTTPGGVPPEQGELLPQGDQVVKKSPPPEKPKPRKRVVYTVLERLWAPEQIEQWQQRYRQVKRGLWPTQAVVDGLVDQIGYAMAGGATAQWVAEKMAARDWITFEWQWVRRDFERRELEPNAFTRPQLTKHRPVMDIVTDTNW